MPAHSYFFEFFSGWKFTKPVLGLRGLLETQIINRQNIGSRQLEEEEHLCRPTTDPVNRIEFTHSILVGQTVEAFQVEPTIQ